MAEVKHRCRLYFQFPAQPSAKLEAQLAQALATTDAACVLLCGDGNAIDEDHAGRLIDLVQASRRCLSHRGRCRACRAARRRRRASSLPTSKPISAARKLLGESASIGALLRLRRHDAMHLAELGADYVASGRTPKAIIDAIDQYAELIAWWAEIFVVPCVAWNVETAEQAAKFASLGADFVAPSARIWQATMRCAASPRSIMPSASQEGCVIHCRLARRGAWP